MNLEQIDTSTTAGKARVMQLAAEGRRIAIRGKKSEHWHEIDYPVWDWARDDHAIIAETVGPEEVFVTVYDGSPTDVFTGETTVICSLSGKVVRYIRADLAGEKG